MLKKVNFFFVPKFKGKNNKINNGKTEVLVFMTELVKLGFEVSYSTKNVSTF